MATAAVGAAAARGATPSPRRRRQRPCSEEDNTPTRWRWRRVVVVADATRVRAGKRSDWDLLHDELRASSSSSSSSHRVALGVDYGRRRTGLAVSSTGASPIPLAVIPSVPPHELVRAVVDAARRERATEIIVGLPTQPAASEARRRTATGRARSCSKKNSTHAANPAVVELPSAWRATDSTTTPFEDAEAVAEALGMDELSDGLTSLGMKAGGDERERAARAWALIAAGGDLRAVPDGMFRGGAVGKRERIDEVVRSIAAAAAREEEVDEEVDEDDDEDDDDDDAPPPPPPPPKHAAAAKTVLRGGSRSQRASSSKSRPPLRMDRICARFAEDVADVAASHGLAVYLYDETLTSRDAEAAALASGRGVKGGKRRPSSRRREHLDDVAAAMLLEKYFAKDAGEAILVPPKDVSYGGVDAGGTGTPRE